MQNKITLLICLLNFDPTLSKSYANYTLYRAIPINEYHLEYYQNLTSLYDVNFWREPGEINKPVDIMIAPDDRQAFMKDVIRNGLYLTTVIEDVQRVLNQQKIKTYIRRRTESFDWMHYYRLNDIYVWLRDLASLYPKKMKLRVIGTTHEKREIIAVLVNLRDEKYRDSRSLPLKKVMVEGGIHAREWISSAFVTYFLNSIVHAPYSDDEDFKKLAYMYEWHFVPVLNPDGYEYTFTKDRMWRKNRRGHGVDLNRNFDYSFGSRGISFISSTEIYCGDSAFSEPETIAMSKLVRQHSKNLEYYLAFHAYGQYMIIPYANEKTHSGNFDDVKLMATIAAKDLQKLYGTKYTIGTAYDTVGYMTSGISGDWVKRTFGTNVVCTFELRDSGNYGFALPPRQIIPTCEETMVAVRSLLTPRKDNWKEGLNLKEIMLDGQTRPSLNAIVIFCNVLLFIILCFDYLLGLIVLTYFKNYFYLFAFLCRILVDLGWLAHSHS